MSCNANNHPPDCNCGWGGIFYGKNENYRDPDWSKESSYLNPNARCPICSQPVFFYRSQNGGAVFFEHPGPPWPKHPCTNPDEKLLITTEDAIRKRKSGWWPLLRDHPVLSTSPLPGNEGVLIWDKQDRGILIRGDYKVLRNKVPIWIRRANENPHRYQISTVKTEKNKTFEVTYNAYTGEAINAPDVARQFKKTIKWIESIIENLNK